MTTNCFRHERESARHYAASAFWALVTVALVVGIVFLAAFHSSLASGFPRVGRCVDARTGVGLRFGADIVCDQLTVKPIAIALNAHQEGYLVNIWGIASGFVSLVGLIVVTRFHGGLPQLIVALSGPSALVLLANAYHALRPPLPVARACALGREVDLHPGLLKLGGKYILVQMAALAIYRSQAIIITQMLGPSQVVIFVVTYKVVALPVDLAYLGDGALHLRVAGKMAMKSSRRP